MKGEELGKMILVSSIVCVTLLLLLAMIKMFEKLWWKPARIRKLMALQGIQGPSYRLIHGNTIEISNMKREAMSRPMSLLHDSFPQVQPHIHLWTKLYGKNYLQWHGSKPQLVITEAAICKDILNNNDGAVQKAETIGYVKKLLGDGLTRSSGEKWSKMKKLANHAFHGERLKSMIPAMIASGETMLERLKNHQGREIEVYDEFRFFTSEVISRTAFGSSYLEGENIFEMLMKLAFLTFKNTHKIRFPGISKIFKTRDEIESAELEKGIRNSVMELIKKREKKAMAGEEDGFGSDFLGLLLEAHHDTNEKQRISVDDLVDECKTFYLAGQETTTSLLAWTVFLLALHRDWQEEARKEVLQLFGKQTPNPDGIAKLKTMSMIINESLRLYSPIVSLERKTEREVRLGNLVVPANVELLLPNLAFHHDPKFWGEDVHLFKPERFSEGVTKATKDNIVAFLPFGMGPRTCVGFQFVTIEAKIALSMILQNHSFTLSPAYVHSPFQFLTLRPQHGVRVTLHPL
ncbi:unnamed protein product [Prunus armeniaca]